MLPLQGAVCFFTDLEAKSPPVPCRGLRWRPFRLLACAPTLEKKKTQEIQHFPLDFPLYRPALRVSVHLFVVPDAVADRLVQDI